MILRVGKKLLFLILTLWATSLVLFAIFHYVGGDPAELMAGKKATHDQIESLRLSMGLNQPMITQYGQFMRQILHWNWGESWYYRQPVTSLIWNGLGPSLLLTVPIFVLSAGGAIGLALLSLISLKRESKFIMTALALSLMSVSFLTWIVVLQYTLAFLLNLFPIQGWSPHSPIYSLALPILIGVLVSIGPDLLMFRTLFEVELAKNYIKTARAKGLKNQHILFRHILKNAALPITSLLMGRIPYLLLGSLLLESFFSIPGLGGIFVTSLQNADFPLIKALTIILSLTFIVVQFVSDFILQKLDPRLSEARY